MNYKILNNFLNEQDRKELVDLTKKMVWESGWKTDITGHKKSVVSVNDSLFIQDLILRSLNVLSNLSDKPNLPILLHECCVLKYPTDSFTPPHKDILAIDNTYAGSQHWRLNAVITECDGGNFEIDNEPMKLSLGDAIIYRSDALTHSFTKVQSREKYIWSVGILK